MAHCPFIIQTLGIISVIFIPLSSRSKTRWSATNTSASYLDLLLSIGRDISFALPFYDKRYNFNIQFTNFPFLSSNIPTSIVYCVFISQLIWYVRTCSSYECFILRAMRRSNKLLGQEYVREHLIVWNRILWSSMVDARILSNNMKSTECNITVNVENFAWG